MMKVPQTQEGGKSGVAPTTHLPSFWNIWRIFELKCPSIPLSYDKSFRISNLDQERASLNLDRVYSGGNLPIKRSVSIIASMGSRAALFFNSYSWRSFGVATFFSTLR